MLILLETHCDVTLYRNFHHIRTRNEASNERVVQTRNIKNRFVSITRLTEEHIVIRRVQLEDASCNANLYKG